MQYRSDKYGNPLSILGYGCMRFTARAGKIDLNKAEQEIMAAIAGGVNYFDTAYIYNGSEAALGEILRRNSARDKVNIATCSKSRTAWINFFRRSCAGCKPTMWIIT